MTTPGAAASGRSLDRSLLVGVAWTAGAKWVAQVLSWTSTFIFARLLTPNDYGLFGMAQVFMALLGPIYDFGAGASVVQRREYTDEQVAQVGGLGLLFGFVLFVVTLLLAKPIAAFFGEPEVAKIILIVALFQLLRSFQVLPRSLMARDLDFRRLAMLDATQQIVATTSMFIMAFMGLGVWTLALGPVFATLVATPLSLRMRGHRLAWPSDRSTRNEASRFGFHVISARVGRYLYGDADFLVVGRMLGKTALGLYTIGWTIATIPVERISELLTQVMPSVFSAVKQETAALRRYFLAITQGIALLTFPASVGMALVAPEFVDVVLGTKWHVAIVPLQILSLYASIRSLSTVFAPVLVAKGRERSDMRFTLLATLVLPVLFVVGTKWGIVGVAAAWVIGFPVVAIPEFRLALKVTETSWGQYVRALEPALVGTAVMAAAVWATQLLVRPRTGDGLTLAAECTAGALAYLVVMRARYWDRLLAVKKLIRESRG